jgi:hypothetical protein
MLEGSVPEMLFRVNHDAGYWLSPPILDPAEPFIIRDAHHRAFQSAGHRSYGLFAAAGRDVNRGPSREAVPARDVTPTLLHLARFDMPLGLDGRVCAAALTPALRASRPVRTYETPLDREASSARAFGGADAIAARLRDLGYLE